RGRPSSSSTPRWPTRSRSSRVEAQLGSSATLELHPMTGGKIKLRGPLGLLALAGLISTLTGCGQGTAQRAPDLRRLPLVDGARIVAQAQRCDRGANAFCAVQLVIVNRRFRSSTDL